MKNWTQRAKEAADSIYEEVFAPGRRYDFVSPARDSNGLGMEHLRFMVEELQKGEMTETKACRWLSSVQAKLTSMGLSTLDHEKQRNQRTSDRKLGEPYIGDDTRYLEWLIRNRNCSVLGSPEVGYGVLEYHGDGTGTFWARAELSPRAAIAAAMKLKP